MPVLAHRRLARSSPTTVTRIVDPSPWIEREIAELDAWYAPELGPLRDAVASAQGRAERKSAKAHLAPVLARYNAERDAIEARRGLPW
jgi:hypothetical protein